MIRIITQGSQIPTLKEWKWCKRNINKIAKDYDASVVSFDSTGATLRDNYGRLLFVDEVSKRFFNKFYR